MPISRSWVEDETSALSGFDRSLARFALIVAKSAPQIDEKTILEVHKGEEQFIRLLAWASFSGARRVAAITSERAAKLAPRKRGVRNEVVQALAS